MSRFTEFTRERQYLHNVSPRPLTWYVSALEWLPSELPTQERTRTNRIAPATSTLQVKLSLFQ
jgi:hypothetical protein